MAPQFSQPKTDSSARRRRGAGIGLLMGITFAGLAGYVLPIAADEGGEKADLKLRTAALVEISTRADFSGNLLVQPSDTTKPPHVLPLTVSATFQCNQTGIGQTEALRQYSTASAQITLNGQSTENRLAPENTQIAVRNTGRKRARPVTYLSVGGVLRQIEQELLLVPCDPITCPALFNRAGIQTGTRWKADDEAVRAFLALDSLIENRLELLVKEITAETVKVYLMGNVRGEIDTAITDQQVVGVALIDRSSESLKAFRVTIDEKRQISQLAPGFAGQIKLDLRTAPREGQAPGDSGPFQQVSSQKIQQLPLRLLWNTDSQFEMIYDPSWRVIVSDPDAVVLRYVRGGNLLAQCSILRLPKRPADRPLQMAQFREEIEKMVAESQARVVGAEVATTRSGLHVIRVTVTGQQDGLAVQWRYYHLSNPDGRCIALVFTAEEEAALEFATADIQLLESVRFPDLPAAAQERIGDAGRQPPRG